MVSSTRIPSDFEVPDGMSFSDYLDMAVYEALFHGLTPDEKIDTACALVNSQEIEKIRDLLSSEGGYLDHPGLRVSDTDMLMSLLRARKGIRIHLTPEHFAECLVDVNGSLMSYEGAISAMDEDTRYFVLRHGGLDRTPQEFVELYSQYHLDRHEEGFEVRL